jgi:MCP family monocarboxylic acid transporter-like MFS transporter 10
MLIAATAAAGVILFCWLPVHTEGGVIAFAILYGFMSGTYVGLAASLYRSLRCVTRFRPAPRRALTRACSSHVGEVGIRLGIAWAVIAVAALVGTPINGCARAAPRPPTRRR